MASKPAEVPRFSTARTVPVPDTTPLHSHISFRDTVRMALFLLVPIYARIYLFSSISVAFGPALVFALSTLAEGLLVLIRFGTSSTGYWRLAFQAGVRLSYG
jgi:hypothetical protein